MCSLEEWCIPIDKDLYDAATKLCEELGTTLEEVTVAFLKFCIVPENLPKVKEILGITDDVAEAKTIKGEAK